MVDVGEQPVTVRRFLLKQKIDIPVLLDVKGEISEKYHVFGHPVKFLIDRKGRVVFQALGYRDWGSEKWIASLENFIERTGKSVAR